MAVRLIQGDCLTEMAKLPAGSVDAIICDLPYSTTQNSWDRLIPFEPMWVQYWRVLKPNGAVVLTATQPFSSALVSSQTNRFKYEWIWEKTIATGFLNAKKQPLRAHETILVFASGQTIYNPQMIERAERKVSRRVGTKTTNYGAADKETFYDSTHRYPRSVQVFPSRTDGVTLHPTQKPVALMEYLIRTYTNPGDTVLDNTCGSGTTLVAAINTGRNAIGIERDPEYFKIAQSRVAEAERVTLAAGVRAAQPRLVVDLVAFRRVAEWNKRVRSFQGAAA